MSRNQDTQALLTSSNDEGIYIRTRLFQSALDGLSRGFRGLIADVELDLQSPGFIARGQLDRSSYIDKFPQFVSRIVPELQSADAAPPGLVALPSACLCLYPVMEGRTIPASGYMAKVIASCFRNEAGYGPERMRSFTMSEYVFFGGPDQTGPFRQRLVGLVQDWLKTLDLEGRLTTATDPFFGRMGEMLASKQLAEELKLELFLPISDTGEIACFSFNDHRDFFASRWDIETEGRGEAHSACVGVGLERLTLALFHRHGVDLEKWPAAVRGSCFGEA